jgi:hypothetical protein
MAWPNAEIWAAMSLLVLFFAFGLSLSVEKREPILTKVFFSASWRLFLCSSKPQAVDLRPGSHLLRVRSRD